MTISVGLGTNLKLSTTQKLTPQLQQAIRILQLSRVELQQEIQAKLESNPMLEEEEDDILDIAESLDDLTANQHLEDIDYDGSIDPASDNQDDSLDKILSSNCDSSAIDTDYENIYTSSPLSSSMNGEEYLAYQGSTSPTIQDHVRWQINFKNLSNMYNLIADYLIDSMDDSGFINLDIDDLYANLKTITSFYQWKKGIQKKDILSVVGIIQSCEPLGVGARGLSECLSLQLEKLDKNTPYINKAMQLLAHSQYLQSNNIDALLKATGLDVNDIEPSLALIRTLNPAPGQTFIDGQAYTNQSLKNYDMPDVLVTVHQNGNSEEMGEDITWKVRLNPETLPRLRINEEYAQLVKRGDDSPDNLYLKENLVDAKLFLRSIRERNHNLLKVASCIVTRQEQFLLHGAIAMEPMILKEIANKLDLHESTISRLTTNKSILTPQGLYPLKYFFSSSVCSDSGNVSSTAICAIIESLIKKENPKKPLSDKAIGDYLATQGIVIARRTIAKYRDSMNIRSSTERRQRY